MSFGVIELPPDVERLTLRVAGEFWGDGRELFLVGGLVRDVLLGAPAGRDLDFATSASPQQTERALRAAGGKVFKIGEKFGTIGGVFDDLLVEVTTYRAEAYQPGSRKPEVAFGRSLLEDLARRDFTINAIALDPRDRTLHDPFGGQEDLHTGTIRAVGNPIERFQEDPLRLLRAVRFASRLDFEIEPQTARAVREAAPALATISRERVRDELEKLLLGPAPSRGIRLLCDLQLADFSLPDVPKLRGMHQETHAPLRSAGHAHAPPRSAGHADAPTGSAGDGDAPFRSEGQVDVPLRSAGQAGPPLRSDDSLRSDAPLRSAGQADSGRHKDVFSHTLQVLDRTPPRVALRWAALLHDIAKPATKHVENGKVTFHGHDHKGERMARRIMSELHQPSELVERVGRLVGLHLRANAYEGEWTDSAVRRFVREVGDDLIEDLLGLSRADVTTGRVERRTAIARSVAELERRIQALRAQEDIASLSSPLDGLDLMQLFERGPGPWIKPIKDHLTELVIDGALAQDDKDAAIPIARRMYAELGLAERR